MNHRIIGDLFSWALGIAGVGFGWINISWGDIIIKIVASLSLAFMGGLLGYFGKLTGAWCIKKIKSTLNKKN